MDKSWRNITIALAGVVQASSLVELLAKTGQLKTQSFNTAMTSLFDQNPESVISVYGELPNLTLGLELLEHLLTHYRDPRNTDVINYTRGILHLQKKLARNKTRLNQVGVRIAQAAKQAEHFGPTHDNVTNNIADIYTDTISTFSYKIQVKGNRNYLQQQRVANQIRALLLAGIRAATLWRQVGGNRLHLILHRAKMIDTTALLANQSRC